VLIVTTLTQSVKQKHEAIETPDWSCGLAVPLTGRCQPAASTYFMLTTPAAVSATGWLINKLVSHFNTFVISSNINWFSTFFY